MYLYTHIELLSGAAAGVVSVRSSDVETLTWVRACACEPCVSTRFKHSQVNHVYVCVCVRTRLLARVCVCVFVNIHEFTLF